MRRRFLCLCAAILSLACVALGCAKNEDAQPDAGLRIVVSNFPLYDFARQIGGDAVQVRMLLPPGAESHTFEPTPKDVAAVQDADVFLYIGGHADEWVERMLSGRDTSKTTRALQDVIPQEKRDETQEDEHIWTSPKNAILMVQAIAEAMVAADPQNAADYEQNAQDYIKQLQALDAELTQIMDEYPDGKVIFADKFPFRYLALDYGLQYDSAYASCEASAEPSGAVIARLIDEVKALNLADVFTIEFSTGKIADVITAETGAQRREMHSAHNVSKEDFEAGVTYLQLMQRNAQQLNEALASQ